MSRVHVAHSLLAVVHCGHVLRVGFLLMLWDDVGQDAVLDCVPSDYGLTFAGARSGRPGGFCLVCHDLLPFYSARLLCLRWYTSGVLLFCGEWRSALISRQGAFFWLVEVGPQLLAWHGHS